MALVDLEGNYKSAPPKLTYTPQPDPFANYVDETGSVSTANYKAWGTTAPTTVSAPAGSPTGNKWNSQYQAWEDASGNLWDSASGTWYDPDSGKVWSNNTNSWQTPEQYRSTWDAILGHDQAISNTLGSQPTGQATYTPNPGFQSAWRAFDRNTVAPTGEFQQPRQTLSGLLMGGVNSVRTGIQQANTYSLGNTPSMLDLEQRGRGLEAFKDTGMTDFLPADMRSGRATKALGAANKYFFDPVAETGAQLTQPALTALRLSNPIAASGDYLLDRAGLPTPFGSPQSQVAGSAADLGELGSTARQSGGSPLKFAELQQENLHERPMWQQLGAQMLFDPTNAIGAGIGAKALKGGIKGEGLLSDILRGAAKVDRGIDALQARTLSAGLKYGGREALGAGLGAGANQLAGGKDATGLEWWQAGALGALGGNVSRGAKGSLPGRAADTIARAQGRTGLAPALGGQIDDVSNEVTRRLDQIFGELDKFESSRGIRGPRLLSSLSKEDRNYILTHVRANTPISEISYGEPYLALGSTATKTPKGIYKTPDGAEVTQVRWWEFGAPRQTPPNQTLAHYLAEEGGAVPTKLALKAGAAAVAGAATYAYNSDDDPRTRLLKSLGVAVGVALGPDALKAGYGKLPKRGKTPLDIDRLNALASPEPVELGNAGTLRALERKTATTKEAGKLGELAGKIPAVKATAAVVNPSITLDPSVHIANQASMAVQADVATRLAATRKPLVEQIEDAFGELAKSADGSTRGAKPVEYLGPADRPAALIGTIPDMKENPADYVLDPFQKATLDLWTIRDNIAVNSQRADYAVDIGLFHPENGGSYTPHINTNQDLVQQGLTTEARMTRPALGKPRSYETMAERMLKDDTFLPETDPLKLLEYHDNQLARMSGQRVFMEGVGGKTRVEVLEEVRPDLIVAKKKARATLDSLKGKMERRLEREGSIAAAMRKNLSKARQIDERLAPLEARVNALADVGDYGPELSHLAGQAYELRLQLDTLERLVDGTKKKPGLASAIVTNDAEIQTLRKQVDVAQKQVEEVMDAYMNANITKDGYVRSNYTYRYHDPAVAKSIERVKAMPGDNKALDVLVKAKGTALSSDGSPINIQGLLQFFRDPWNTTKAWALMMLDGGASLDEVARREPELVSRYVQARARALGQVTEEFDPTHSLVANIPGGVGDKFVQVEDSMFNAIQRVDYETWKATRNLLEKINPGVSQDVIDHEAANAISKSNPSLSGVERGVSPARARVETAALTSVSFMASPVLVLKDAASAVVKLAVGQRPRGREQVALAHAITLGTTILGLSAASAAATADGRNLSPEEAVKRALNPARKDFMSLFLPGGHRLPLGGPYRSFIRSLTPMDVDGNPRVPNLINWAEGRIAPLGGAGIDLIRNKDFSGSRVRGGNDLSVAADSLWYLLEQGVLPLSVGGAAEVLRKGGSLKEAAIEALGQTLGNQPQPPTPTDRLDSIAHGWPENGGKDFYKSPPSVQADIKEQHPDLWEQAVEAGSAERKAAFAKEQELLGFQKTSDAMLASNDITAADWRDAYHERYDALRNQKEGIYALTEFEIKGDPRLAGYFETIEKATGPDGSVDWDRVEAYTATLSADDRGFIEENTGLALRTDTTKEYRADMKKIQDAGYWDVDDEVWAFFVQEFDVGGAQSAAEYWTAMRKDLISYADSVLTKQYGDSWRTNTPNGAVELGNVAFEKVKGKYDDAIAKARKAWRAEHPEEGQLLAKWQLGGTGKEETIGRITAAND